MLPRMLSILEVIQRTGKLSNSMTVTNSLHLKLPTWEQSFEKLKVLSQLATVRLLKTEKTLFSKMILPIVDFANVKEKIVGVIAPTLRIYFPSQPKPPQNLNHSFSLSRLLTFHQFLVNRKFLHNTSREPEFK